MPVRETPNAQNVPRGLLGHLLSPFGEWALGGFAVAPLFVAAVVIFLALDEEKGGPAPPVGRNQPCPCGSGLKYKRCCGAEPAAAT